MTEHQEQTLIFKHPFTMTVSGPTCCGKTTWLKNVLLSGSITPSPRQIIWCYREWQPLYREMMQQIQNITFVEGIQVPETNTGSPQLIVLDDLMIDASKNKDVSNMFTVGSHHRNMSIVCLLQNVFYQGKENRTMSLNSHYLVLFKNPRDQLQVSCLARQMYPHNSGHFMEKFQKATAQPYGCLVVDLKQDTPDSQRLKSGNVLYGEGPQKPVQTKPPGIPAYPHKELKGFGLQWMGIKQEPEPVSDHLESGSQPVNIMSSCGECGLCFESPYFLKMHQDMGCILSSEDDDGEEKTNPWRGLLQQTFDKHNKEYNEKIDDYIEEGLSEKDATQKRFRELIPQYKRSLIQNYKNFLKEMYALSKSSHHKEIMQVLDWYMGWKGYTFEKAMEVTLKKKRKVFEDLIEDQEDEDESEDDTEVEEGEEEEEEEEEMTS